jgi:hypothetical protein
MLFNSIDFALFMPLFGQGFALFGLSRQVKPVNIDGVRQSLAPTFYLSSRFCIVAINSEYVQDSEL